MDRSDNSEEDMEPMDISKSTQSTNDESPLSISENSSDGNENGATNAVESVNTHFTNVAYNAACVFGVEQSQFPNPIIRNDFNCHEAFNLQIQSLQSVLTLNNNDLNYRQFSENNNQNNSDLADIQSILSNTVSKNLLRMNNNNNNNNNNEMVPQRNSITPNSDDVGNQQDEEFRKKFRLMKLRGEFPCDLCDQIFPNLRAVKGHNKKHLDDPMNRGPYQCNICPYISTDKLSVHRHMKSHYGDKPYECMSCSYKFTTKANCERHIRNIHFKTDKVEIKKLIKYDRSEDPTSEQLSQILAEDNDGNGNVHEIRERRANIRLNMNGGTQLLRHVIPPVPILSPAVSSMSFTTSPEMEEQQEQALDLSMKRETITPPEPNPVCNSSDGSDEIGANNTLPIFVQNLNNVLSELGEEPSHLRQCLFNYGVRRYCHDHYNDPSFRQNFRQQINENPAMYNLMIAPSGLDILYLRERLLQLLPASFIANGSIPQYLLPISLQELPERNTFERRRGHMNQTNRNERKNTSGLTRMVVENGVLVEKPKQHRFRKDKPYECKFCSSKFTLRSNKMRHVKQQHLNKKKKKTRRNGSEAVDGNGDGSDYENDQSQNESDVEGGGQENNNDVQMQVKVEDAVDEDGDNLVIDESTIANNVVENSDVNVLNSSFNLVAENKSELNGQSCTESVPSTMVMVLNNRDPHQVSIDDDTDTDRVSMGSGRDADYESYDEDGIFASCSYSDSNLSPPIDENKLEMNNVETKITMGLDSNANHQLMKIHTKQKTSAYAMAPNRIQCYYCKREFPWKSSLRRHILTHTGQKPYSCTQCDLLFTTKSNRDRHVDRIHINKSLLLKSKKLNNSTSYSSSNSGNESGIIATNNNNSIPSELNEQSLLLRNVPERPYKCSLCPSSTFASPVNLQKHVMSRHRPDNNNVLFKLEDGGLQREQQINTNCNTVVSVDLPFKCHLCVKSYASSYDNLEHIKEEHRNEYELLESRWGPNFRTLPPSAFHQRDADDDHRGTYQASGNRKASCSLCYKWFWSAEDLRRHVRTHTGHKPYECKVCSQKFSLKHSMIRHYKKHLRNHSSQESNFITFQQQLHNLSYTFPFISNICGSCSPD